MDIAVKVSHFSPNKQTNKSNVPSPIWAFTRNEQNKKHFFIHDNWNSNTIAEGINLPKME